MSHSPAKLTSVSLSTAMVLALGAVCARAAAPPANAVESILRNGDAQPAFGLAPALALNSQTRQSSGHRAASDEFGESEHNKVNVGRAVGLSLLLPGAGQWYVGRPGRAGVFLGVEAATWTALGYFLVVKSQKQDDYRLYARAQAGVDPTGKSDEFYRMLSFYDSREQYNDEGRLLDASRPYYPDTPEWNWRWESPASRQHFRSIRNQSNEAKSRAKFSLGIALLNRVVSAVDAWRTARAINREARMETAQWKVRVNGKPDFENPSLAIVLTRPLF
jgi:hypothetical protein